MIDRKAIIQALKNTSGDEYETPADVFVLAAQTDEELVETLINCLYYFHDAYNEK